MKKTILAVVTTSLLAASANAATVFDKDGQQLDIYGQLRYMAGQKDNGTVDTTSASYNAAKAGKADNFGGDSRVRLGIDGKWATGYSDVALISKLEWQVSSQSNATSDGDKNTFDARYSYIGADFGNGVQTVVGAIASPYQQLTDTTDIYQNYSGGIEDQSAGDIWDDGVAATYTADGWDLRSAVAFSDEEKNGADSTDLDTNKTQTRYGVTAGYTLQLDDISSLKPVLAYQAEEGKTAAGLDYTNSQYAAGLGYTYDAFYVASTYGQAKSDTDTLPVAKSTVWSVVASYKVLPEWTVLANYGLVDPHNNGAASGSWGEYYVLASQYDITTKAKAFVEYKINQVSGQDDNYIVGLQYTF